MQTHLNIHQKLVQAVKNLRKNEAEILDLIAQADQTKDFLMLMQYPSLFSYCVKGIGLTEAETCNFLALYKKSKEIPALTEAIQSGEVSVSKLRHICPVINQENQKLWIEKAKSETNKKLIDEVAKETLERKDPVKKAERAEARDKKKEADNENGENGSESEPVSRQERKALPKRIVHAIHQRDRGQCCYFGVGQNRCKSRYRVEIHHITPLSRGGQDTIENLVTLCHDHHKLIHETFFSQGRSWVQTIKS